MRYTRELFTFATVGLLAAGLFIAGCSSPSGTSAQPKPGTGIAEYRELARDAHRAVAAMVDSLEDLSRSSAKNAKDLQRFDRALHQLEVTSVKTRARAEAIIARGQAYFDEWKGQLTASTNTAAVSAETKRYARLHEHFDRILERSSEVRAEFRPFMMELRKFRATLDSAPMSSGSASSRQRVDSLSATGRRVLDILTEVSGSLDAAEMELRASRAPKKQGRLE